MKIPSLLCLFLVAATFAARGEGYADGGVKFTGVPPAPAEPLSLWYRRPATKWVEALPIGNGRIGAMVFGGVEKERLQLNEDTLWGGGPYDPVNPEAKAALPAVRQLVFAGNYGDASKMVGQKVISRPAGQMPYETAGDLVLAFPDAASVENYRRDLNLDRAVTTVEYSDNGTGFSRQVFASPVDQVMVVWLTANKRAQSHLTAGIPNAPECHHSNRGREHAHDARRERKVRRGSREIEIRSPCPVKTWPMAEANRRHDQFR